MQIFKFTIPWKTWALNVPETKMMKRYERVDEPGQILVLTENAFMKFFSPRNGELLNTAVPTGIVVPKSCYYSRGCYTYIHNNEFELCITQCQSIPDEMFVMLSMNRIYSYLPEEKPCIENRKIKMDCSFMCDVLYKGEWLYAVSLYYAELFFVTRDTFEMVRRYPISRSNVFGMYFNYIGGSIIMLYEGILCLIDVNNGHFLQNVKVKSTTVHGFDNNLLLLGYKNGKIEKIQISDNKFCFISDSEVLDHNGPVTGFSYCTQFWVSCGMDGHLLFWDYDCMILLQVHLPLPLYSVCIINAKWDIILATKKEIMIIPGDLLFENEEENPVFSALNVDMYDQLRDPLSQEAIVQQFLIAGQEIDENELQAYNNSSQQDREFVKKTLEDIKTKTRRDSLNKSLPFSFDLDPVRDRARILEEMFQMTLGDSYKPPIEPKKYERLQISNNSDDDAFITEPKQIARKQAPRKKRVRKVHSSKDSAAEESVKEYSSDIDLFMDDEETKVPIPQKIQKEEQKYDFSSARKIFEKETTTKNKAPKQSKKKKKIKSEPSFVARSKDANSIRKGKAEPHPPSAQRQHTGIRKNRSNPKILATKSQQSIVNVMNIRKRKGSPILVFQRNLIIPVPKVRSKTPPKKHVQRLMPIEPQPPISISFVDMLLDFPRPMRIHKSSSNASISSRSVRSSGLSRTSSSFNVRGACHDSSLSRSSSTASLSFNPDTSRKLRVSAISTSSSFGSKETLSKNSFQLIIPHDSQYLDNTESVPDSPLMIDGTVNSPVWSTESLPLVELVPQENKGLIENDDHHINIPTTVNQSSKDVSKLIDFNAEPIEKCAIITHYQTEKRATPMEAHKIAFKKGAQVPENVPLHFLNIDFPKETVKYSSQRSMRSLKAAKTTKQVIDELETAVMEHVPFSRFKEPRKQKTNTSIKRYSVASRPKKTPSHLDSKTYIHVRPISPATHM